MTKSQTTTVEIGGKLFRAVHGRGGLWIALTDVRESIGVWYEPFGRALNRLKMQGNGSILCRGTDFKLTTFGRYFQGNAWFVRVEKMPVLIKAMIDSGRPAEKRAIEIAYGPFLALLERGVTFNLTFDEKAWRRGRSKKIDLTLPKPESVIDPAEELFKKAVTTRRAANSLYAQSKEAERQLPFHLAMQVKDAARFRGVIV